MGTSTDKEVLSQLILEMFKVKYITEASRSKICI